MQRRQSHWVIAAMLPILAALISGCTSSLVGAPARLYSTQAVRDDAKKKITKLEDTYYSTSDENLRRRARNEIIGLTMTAMDAGYTAYEVGLTVDRQSVGFGAGATSIALNAAGQWTAAKTTKILGGIAGAATGIKGQFDSEIYRSKAVEVIAGQMRAARDRKGRAILEKLDQSTTAYPLSIARSDLEDYYRAGTFNSGLMAASAASGADARAAALSKDAVVEIDFGEDANTTILSNYLFAPDADTAVRAEALDAILRDRLGSDRRVEDILYDAKAGELRKRLVEEAKLK